MKSLIEKIWKSIFPKRDNSEQETYCEMRKREKLEEKMRAAEKEKKPKGGFAY